jgi:hypothetical protein
MTQNPSGLELWLVFAAAVVPTLGVVLAAFLAARPLYRTSKAERDARLVTLFVEIMAKAPAREDRVVGVGEQNAAIAAVAGMGVRYPDVLLEPALAGLESINTFFADSGKERLIALPESLKKLKDIQRA